MNHGFPEWYGAPADANVSEADVTSSVETTSVSEIDVTSSIETTSVSETDVTSSVVTTTAAPADSTTVATTPVSAAVSPTQGVSPRSFVVTLDCRDRLAMVGDNAPCSEVDWATQRPICEVRTHEDTEALSAVGGISGSAPVWLSRRGQMTCICVN